MSETMKELTATIEKLAGVNERRANLIAYRDRQIKAALDAGDRWTDIKNVTGLSPNGLALAIKRAERVAK